MRNKKPKEGAVASPLPQDDGAIIGAATMSDGSAMSTALLDEIQKSIYVALESADTATDAVKELARLKAEIIERAEGLDATSPQVDKRVLWIVLPACGLAVILMVVGAFMLLSARHEFARIAEVTRETLKTYITDVNTLTKELGALAATRQELEGLATAVASQQQESGRAMASQKETFEALAKDVRSHQAAVTDILSRGRETTEARRAPASAPAPAPAPERVDAGMEKIRTDLASANERLRVIQQLLEKSRAQQTSVSGPPSAGRDLADAREEILATLRGLRSEQSDLIKSLQQGRSNGLHYP